MEIHREWPSVAGQKPLTGCSEYRWNGTCAGPWMSMVGSQKIHEGTWGKKHENT